MCLCGAFMMYARRTINVISKIDRVRGNYSVNLLVVFLSLNVSKVTDNMLGGNFRTNAIAIVFLQRLLWMTNLFPSVNEAIS